MKTKHERKIQNLSRRAERGNALIYVLIAIALFAALSFVLARQTQDSGGESLSGERAELYATQIITYAAQVQSVYDQMEMSGAQTSDIIFTLPTDAAFNDNSVANNIFKIYHPEGGGLSLGSLDESAVDDSAISTPDDPAPGWYLGRFNNVDWSASTANDIILTAYGLHSDICANINKKITGNTTIPTIGDTIKEVFVPQSTGSVTNYSVGTNVPTLTTTGGTPICAACAKVSSLCVQEGGIYALYAIIASR
jgi:hypothetical protein